MKETPILRNNPPSKLELLYRSVPEGEKIHRAVKAGHEKFLNEIASFSSEGATSVTHSWEDTEAQAFILALQSENTEKDAEELAFRTFLAHWFDDYVDIKELSDAEFDFEEVYKNRLNIQQALTAMGSVGKVCLKNIEETEHPDAVFRGFQRVLYGGLFIQAETRGLDETTRLFREYQALSVNGLEEALKKDILSLSPDSYSLTTKTTMEIFSTRFHNPNVTEAWSLIYAPALYNHDYSEEKDVGEAFFSNDIPENELLKLIRVGTKHAQQHEDPQIKARIKQLACLIKTFQSVLSPALLREYQTSLETLKKKGVGP